MTPKALAVIPDLERRFGGLQRLYGRAGADRIRGSHVAVVGIGGVGSWAVEALARSGVGRLTLIDLDHIAESNVNRQIHAIDSTLGQAKVDAMRDRIAQINSTCVVACVEAFVQPDNWPQLLAEPVDAVIDACDQVHAKVAIAAWACRSPRRIQKTSCSVLVPQAASAPRTASTSMICRLSRTIRCLRKSGGNCAKTTVRRRSAGRSACLACSAANP